MVDSNSTEDQPTKSMFSSPCVSIQLRVVLVDIISHVVYTYDLRNTSQSSNLKYNHNIVMTLVKNSKILKGIYALLLFNTYTLLTDMSNP